MSLVCSSEFFFYFRFFFKLQLKKIKLLSQQRSARTASYLTSIWSHIREKANTKIHKRNRHRSNKQSSPQS